MSDYEFENERLNNLREKEDRLLKECYRLTFSTKHGKKVFADLLSRCHVFQTTFTGNSKTFFLEGERNIGLYLLGMMSWATVEGLEIIKEIDNG